MIRLVSCRRTLPACRSTVARLSSLPRGSVSCCVGCGRDLHGRPATRLGLSSYPRHFSSTASPIPDDEPADGGISTTTEDAPIRQLSVEEQYSRKTPIEHVLLRPGMYVGPTERLPPVPCWVLETPPETPPSVQLANGNPDFDAHLNDIRMVRKEYGLVPALNKVFDEILVNASDNRLRHPKSCTRLDVTIDPGCAEEGILPCIGVYNDGKGVPVQIHRKEKLYVPEMVFGHLLTGSNFDDNAKRITGGRHGYGAKLTNIFSKSFTVETADSRKGLMYRQTWQNNMSIANEPEITKMSPSSGNKFDWTRVTFVPDIPKLTGNPSDTTIPPEDYAIMCRRVVDVAGCAGDKIEVTLNGRKVPVASFEEYSQLYRPRGSPPLVRQKINSRWEVGVGLSDSGSFESVSFVNGMATTRGGTHVNALVQQITKRIADRVIKGHPDLAEVVTQGLVRRNVCIFVNTLIENATFDSQMKEALTSNPSSFGSRYVLSERFLSELIKDEWTEDGEHSGPGIVEEILRVARGRQQANLLKQVGGGKKTKRRIISIPKLDDAHLAGTDMGQECTLILTEGDSAKALAVAGLEVIGRERYGVFPLRGKFLNVRDASVDKVTKNAEVKALSSILGLDSEKKYDTQKERLGLRYGHVMLMTDQDTDGSHIKGLVMNFFRTFWPDLLMPALDEPNEKPFLSSFVTPLIKATKGKKGTKSFLSMAEYNEWRSSMKDGNEIRRWNVKYYKGLGTSTPAEAKEYFSTFDDHHRPFKWHSEEDGALLDMVFDKHRASDRRAWITNEYDEASTLSVDKNDGNSVSFEDFINNEMVHFSNADNIRSLPSVVDGLKPSQRKVLYACFKRHLKKEMKVAQLAGYCAEHTAYHHGEASLHATIIGMAQDFVGSNNINLLVPSGQFGTRLAGGKDAASPRYIFTALAPIARLLFPEVDDAILNYREDDGQSIEPEMFCPVIPLLLVNGSQGIGTGWSTFIPPHNPHDVLKYIRAKLDGSELPPIRPWVRGFTGDIRIKDDVNGYSSIGKIKKLSSTSLLISELPVGRWTNDYKRQLLTIRDKGEILSILEDHTTTSVAFTVSMRSAELSRKIDSDLHRAFKLISNLPTTNMNAFDPNNTIQRFDSAESIADAFFPTRLGLYHDRKSLLEKTLNYSATVNKNKADFIAAVTEGKVDIVRGQKSKAQAAAVLVELGFAKSSKLDSLKASATKTKTGNISDSEEVGQEVPTEEGKDDKEFDYLLNMPLSSLTTEKIHALREEAQKTKSELDAIKSASPEDLWHADLDKLESSL